MSESVNRAVSVAISAQNLQFKTSLQLAVTQLHDWISADGDLA